MTNKDAKSLLSAIDKAVNSKDLFKTPFFLTEKEAEAVKTAREAVSGGTDLVWRVEMVLVGILERAYQ